MTSARIANKNKEQLFTVPLATTGLTGLLGEEPGLGGEDAGETVDVTGLADEEGLVDVAGLVDEAGLGEDGVGLVGDDSGLGVEGVGLGDGAGDGLGEAAGVIGVQLDDPAGELCPFGQGVQEELAMVLDVFAGHIYQKLE